MNPHWVIKSILGLVFLVVAMGVSAEKFKGYACTVDCSGHRAGYAWAKRKGITSKEQCTGNSRSFIEGCRAWVDGK